MRLPLFAALAVLAAPALASADHGLTLSVEPYYSPGYQVGMTARWQPVPGAAKYVAKFYRADRRGSAPWTVETSGLALSTGRYYNAFAPTSCYLFEVTVQAVAYSGAVLAESTASFCDVGNP